MGKKNILSRFTTPNQLFTAPSGHIVVVVVVPKWEYDDDDDDDCDD